MLYRRIDTGLRCASFDRCAEPAPDAEAAVEAWGEVADALDSAQANGYDIAPDSLRRNAANLSVSHYTVAADLVRAIADALDAESKSKEAENAADKR